MAPSDRTAVKDGAVICLTLIAVGLSYGSLSHQAGLHLWQTAFLAALAYGGAAEILFVGTLGAGGSPVAAVLGGVLVNSRNLAYGMNVGTIAPRGWRAVAGAHLVNDETMAFSRVREPADRRWRRFSVLGIALLLSWLGGAVAGQLVAGLTDTDAFGVDTAFPVILVAMVLPDLRRRPTLLAALAAAVVSVSATPVVPSGLAAVCALVVLLPWALSTRRSA
ncbi:AzlC family ABC transporter permease [Corynebacterium sp.]|uniref:AzlC family ABC transporter permease n=1 Tax=Corynebacterium sp. TaxID=1720 RepID=UPI0025BFC8F2|nr:AzlC family ABC transporter permease [Corynebacterium sp.]